MKLTIKESSYKEDDWSQSVNGYYISMSWENGAYTVEVCEEQGNGRCGYPIHRNRYSSEESAKRMFRKRIKQFS